MNKLSPITGIFLILTFVVFDCLMNGKSFYSMNQELQFGHTSINKGLSQSIVLCILQDHNGFLWIGTQDGLNKFDGYGFKKYYHNPGNDQSISSDYITSLYEDSKHNLWIGTNKGLDKFNLISEKFTHYLRYKKFSDKKKIITDISADSSGNLWFGTILGGLKYLNLKTNEIKSLKFNDGINSNYITKLLWDKKNNALWIGTDKGLTLMDITTRKFKNLNRIIFKGSTIKDKKIRSLLLDSKKNVWIGTNSEGVIKIENYSGFSDWSDVIIKQYKNDPDNLNSISGNSINSIYETQQGEIWFGIWGGGICRLDDSLMNGKAKFLRSLHDENRPYSISVNDIIVITEDNSGIMWIGTYGGGLNKVNPNENNFKIYSHIPGNKNSLSDNKVFSIYQDKKYNLWIGTWEGLDEYNYKKGTYKHFIPNRLKKNSLSDKRITSILGDKFGNLWVGTLQGGLNKLNIKSGKFTHINNYLGNQKEISDNQIISLMLSKNGKIWIGTLGSGVSILDPKTEKISKIEISPLSSNKLSNAIVKSLFEDKKGNIWIGTYNGLNMYDPSRKVINNAQSGYIKNSVLQNSRIIAINQTSHGDLWFGTFGNGIVRVFLDNDNQITDEKEFHAADGLPNEYIHNILVDKMQDIWVSTNTGIARYDKKSDSFDSYGAFEGVFFNEFNEGAFFNKSTGSLFLGGINGLIEFNPKELKIRYGTSNIVFTKFKILNKIVPIGKNFVLKKSINETKKIELRYNQNSITLEFAALNFINPNSIKYEYKLDGFDSQYIKTDSQNRIATYTNLPNGKYVFRVKARLSSNMKGNFEKTLIIIISPPLWGKTWFKFTVGIFLIVLFLSAFGWRTYRIKKRNLWLEKEVKLRTKELEEINLTKDKFFSIIAHDLKGPFGYLLNNSELLSTGSNHLTNEEKEELVKIINISANNLNNLLENLLQWAKLQMTGIKPVLEKVNLSSLINSNIKLVNHLAENKNIEIVSLCKNNSNILIDTNMLNTIIRNLLINAIKFTRAKGKVKITTKESNNEIFIIISDTGVGMDKSTAENLFSNSTNKSKRGTNNEKGTGLGLMICKDFVEVLHGHIKVDSTPSKGTSIICSFPLRTIPLKAEEEIV